MTLTEADREHIDTIRKLSLGSSVNGLESAYAAGLAEGARRMRERAARVCERKGQDVADDHYHVEPDTNAGFFDSDESMGRAEMADDCAAAIRALGDA